MKQLTLSAGAVIVRDEPPEPRYLLLRAFSYWDFPKGVVEAGEDPFDAAIREVGEETGLEALDFRWGKGYQETAPYGFGKVARYYLAESREGEVYLPINPTLGRPEHEEFRWLNYDQAHALLAPRLKTILNWADWLVQHSHGE
ncbi:bis(5'-nucleosyl)-tetraphosphatase [Methylococcus sp. EFPC2]|uniref:bis(5'-nucleosyl)-tetraphosphatase n=1 Tax=Methylococcus sp. EFPC2 TaxID=2812648 RepID=UPI0019680DBE|nr:bis(5'-nucleosyl)-tetraphosphatase [Methylococcus sp. EFPC2]QSA96977.1 NUDIX domain-containing protein [Methylococcus sp. EFPC2]